MKNNRFVSLVSVVALAMAMFSFGLNLLLLTAPAVEAQQNKDRFNGILVDHDADIDGDLDVDGTANLDVVDVDGAADFATTVTVGTGLTVTAGGATVTAGGLTVNGGNTVLSGGLNCTPQTSAITATFIITPTSCIVPR